MSSDYVREPHVHSEGGDPVIEHTETEKGCFSEV